MSVPKVNNSTVRIWTKAELKQTIKEAKEGGFKVIRNRDYAGQILIQDPSVTDNSFVIQAMDGPSGRMLIRVDLTYFGE